MKNCIVLLFILLIWFFRCENIFNSDDILPTVIITKPVNGEILTESIMIKVYATDNPGFKC